MKKYLALKLTSGSDILGTLVKATTNETILSNVMIIISSIYENGSTLVFLRQWATLCLDSELKIKDSQIITSYVPQKELIEYYEVMVEYNKIFIEKDIHIGMNTAIKMIKKAIDSGSNYSADSNYDSLSDDVDDFYSNLTKPRNKKKAH